MNMKIKVRWGVYTKVNTILSCCEGLDYALRFQLRKGSTGTPPVFFCKIFYSAIELVQQKGTEGFSIRKLADMIEYSTRTIYLYFESKYDLFNKTIDRAFEATANNYLVIDKMRSGQNSAEIIRAKIELHIETAIENPVSHQSVIRIIQSNEFVVGENQKKVIQSLSADIEIMIRTRLAMAFLESATILLITDSAITGRQEPYIKTIIDSNFKGIPG